MSENKNKRFWWVRIHRSCVKTDDDAGKLTDIQLQYEGNFNTHNSRNMWFDFPSKLHAIGLANNITSALPYLRITLGN